MKQYIQASLLGHRAEQKDLGMQRTITNTFTNSCFINLQMPGNGVLGEIRHPNKPTHKAVISFSLHAL